MEKINKIFFLNIYYLFIVFFGILDGMITSAFVSLFYMTNKYVAVIYNPFIAFSNLLFVV